MAQIFAYIPHNEGVVDDLAAELAAAAARFAPDGPVIGVVTGSGKSVAAACTAASAAFPVIWKFDHADLSHPNAEVIRKLLAGVLPSDALVLMPHDTFGMDLGPGLSVKLDSTFCSDVVGIEAVDGGSATLVRQEYAGMVHARVTCDVSKGAVLTLRPGSFPAGEGEASGQVEDKSEDLGDLSVKRRFLEVVEAEVGDVDITKSEVLVSVGRGIEEEENIEIATELAEAMGAVVSCSRPIVDAKWMEKSRQVGTSGKTVKPKVYLALGISGSFQHLGGIKGSPFMVAVNKNPKAPIFQAADVGIVEDILEFIPELTERINDL